MKFITQIWALCISVAAIALPPEVNAQVHHYEYVFQDGHIYVYDIDNSFSFVRSMQVPTQAGTRGSVASAATGMLYISYGPDWTSGGGSLLKFDLVKNQVVWTRTYSFGIDSMSVSLDGQRIYMPTGENNSGGLWEVIDAVSGNVLGSINSGGVGPHNTLINPAGTHVYMAPRGSDYLVEADTSNDGILRKIGPVTTVNGPGVRPFTVNQAETLSFMTATGLLGFQVGDIATGKILYRVPIQGFSWNGTGVTCPSHGISMSPDGKEIYVIDQPNSYVHVYDITGLPASPPKQVSNIPLAGKMTGTETLCAYDCGKSGWLHHSRDGHYVFVGDSGDVIDTRTRTTVATIPPLANSKKAIEIDFQNGLPVWAMNNRQSMGGASVSPPPPGPITMVQSGAVEGSSVASVSRAFSSSNTAGNLIIAVVRMSTTTQAVTVTDTAGNPYTQAVAQTQTTDGHQLHIFYARDIIGGSNTVKATFSGTNANPWLAIYEYKGLNIYAPLDETAAAQGSSSMPHTGATLTTHVANELVFVATAFNATSTVTLTSGTGYNIGQQDTHTSRAATETKFVTSIGSYSGTFNLSGNVNWSAVLATFASGNR